MKIGIFDSGWDGLKVLKKIKEKVDFADIIYYGDYKKSKEEKNYSVNIGNFFIDNRVDIIIVICNSNVDELLKFLQEQFSCIPIIGVMNPGILKAIKESKSKKIGIFNNSQLVKNNFNIDTLNKLNSNICYFENLENLKEIPVEIDTIIVDSFIECKGEKIKFIDITEEIALYVLFYLNRLSLKNGYKKIEKSKIIIDYFITGNLEKFKKISENLLNEKLDNVYITI